MKDLNYNTAFAVYYKWQVIATLALVLTSFTAGTVMALIGMAESPAAMNIAIALSVLIWLFAMILGAVKMARAWPTGEVVGFWSGAKVVFLNFGLLGYRHLSLKQLPWKAVLTWGIAAVVISPTLVEPVFAGQWQHASTIAGVAVLLTPIVVVAMWGLGKLLGLAFNR